MTNKHSSAAQTDSAPRGELVLRTVPQPANLNVNGNIFGGWVLSQMDIAGGTVAGRVACGAVATVAIESMSFVSPIQAGDLVSVYIDDPVVGRTSIRLNIQVFAENSWSRDKVTKLVTEGTFIFVAVDADGAPRTIPV